MKLFEVLKPILKQKLMEGQADQIIDQGIQSLEKLVANIKSMDDRGKSSISDVLVNGMKSWKQWRQDLNTANAPNTWKIFLAKAWMATIIDHLLNQHFFGDDLDQNKIRKLTKKTEILRGSTLSVNPWYVDQLMHFSGIDYPPIQNFNPVAFTEQGNNIQDVLIRLEELEKQYAERQTFLEKLVSLTGDENWILEVGEYKWLDFNHWCSEAEGKAMRHCGNVPYGNKTDRVYTLNSIVEYEGHTYRQPWVFIVIQEGGIMGERKGYMNSKPGKEFHRPIIEFIKLPIVKYMKADARHASQNDFQLQDLNESQLEETRQAKGDNFVDFALWGLTEHQIKAIMRFEQDGYFSDYLLAIEPYVEKNKEKIDRAAHETYERMMSGDVVDDAEVRAVFTYNLDWAEEAFNAEPLSDDFASVVQDEAFEFLIADDKWREQYVEKLINDPESVLKGEGNVMNQIHAISYRDRDHLNEDHIFEIFQNEEFLKKHGVSSMNSSIFHGSELAAADDENAFYMRIDDRSDLERFVDSDIRDDFISKLLSGDAYQYFMQDFYINLSEVSIFDRSEDSDKYEQQCIEKIKRRLVEIFGNDLNEYFEERDFKGFEMLISEIETVISDIEDDEEENGREYLSDLEELADEIKRAISNAQDDADQSAAINSLYESLKEAGILGFVYDQEKKVEYAKISGHLAGIILMEDEGYGTIDEYLDIPTFHSPDHDWGGDIQYAVLADMLDNV